MKQTLVVVDLVSKKTNEYTAHEDRFCRIARLADGYSCGYHLMTEMLEHGSTIISESGQFAYYFKEHVVDQVVGLQ